MELCLWSVIPHHELSRKVDVSRCLIVKELPLLNHSSVASVGDGFGELLLHPEVGFLLPGQQDVLIDNVGCIEFDVDVTWFVVYVFSLPCVPGR